MALQAADPASTISKDAHDPKVWTDSVGSALTRQGPYKTGARIEPPKAIVGTPTVCKGPTGRTVSVVTGADGRVALTRDPPPIKEITFAGGGGKGNALPGAVKALAASGVLKGVEALHGASIGSMTAALLAAGITPDAFQHLSDDTNFLALVKGNDLAPIHEDGMAVENLVRDSMGSAINGQIAHFAAEAMKKGIKVDPKTVQTLETISDKLRNGGSPTFMDLRVLHKIIPDIKEVVISGTLVGKSGKPGADGKAGPVKGVKPELMIFSADTQPNLEVAKAVHASAAIPPVFSPAEFKLASGETGRFQDGGIMDNVPNSATLGLDRDIDPVPETGAMSFMFEDEDAHAALDGGAKAGKHSFRDAFLGFDMSSPEYGVNRSLADRPEDLVMVPLTFQRDDGEKADFTGDRKGTFNFSMPKQDRVKLQGMTKEATETHLKKRQAQETRSFASVGQMLACTTREDLQAMAASKFPGAAEALHFRDGVAKQVHALEKLAAGGARPDAPKVQALLTAMTDAAQGDQDRVALIGRELNRSGKLDAFMAQAHRLKPGQEPDALAAGIAVADVLVARKAARQILAAVVRPKMIELDAPDSLDVVTLQQVDTLLRDAKSAGDINRALQIGIDYYLGKPKPKRTLRHPDPVDDRKTFADLLATQRQPVP